MTKKARAPEVGKRLSAARLRRGLSQGTVARRAGIAPSYLSRIETGKIQPTFRMAIRIQQALKADIVEIVGSRPETAHGKGGCPVSRGGGCMLDLIRSEGEVLRKTPLGEYYTPREIRLLARVATWVRSVKPDRLRAMEILFQELTEPGAAPSKRRG